MGLLTAFDLILLQTEWLFSEVSICLCNMFACFCVFNVSLPQLRVSNGKLEHRVLLNVKISHWHLGLLTSIMPSLLNSCLPGSFQKEGNEKENYYFCW